MSRAGQGSNNARLGFHGARSGNPWMDGLRETPGSQETCM